MGQQAQAPKVFPDNHLELLKPRFMPFSPTGEILAFILLAVRPNVKPCRAVTKGSVPVGKVRPVLLPVWSSNWLQARAFRARAQTCFDSRKDRVTILFIKSVREVCCRGYVTRDPNEWVTVLDLKPGAGLGSVVPFWWEDIREVTFSEEVTWPSSLREIFLAPS